MDVILGPFFSSLRCREGEGLNVVCSSLPAPPVALTYSYNLLDPF